jgi:hypothetical protein
MMEKEIASTNALKVFYCYARKDSILRDELEKHLAPLRQGGLITTWYDREILPGQNWEQEINRHLNSADIVLLLVSPSFIHSNYCYGIEMRRALERHQKKEIIVIPVILRPVEWEDTPMKALQALPTDGKPITLWRNRDEAFRDVVMGVGRVARAHYHNQRTYETITNMRPGPHSLEPQLIYQLATNEKAAFSDPLTHQSTYDWSEGKWPDRSFNFSDGAFHIKVQEQGKFVASFAHASNLSDFALQVEMTLMEGDGGGIVFRGGEKNPHGYRFFVGRNGSDLVYDSSTLWEDSKVIIHTSRNYSLSVVAYKAFLFLYLNAQCVASVKNNFARSGWIGMMGVAFADHTHVTFRRLQIWDLSSLDTLKGYFQE